MIEMMASEREKTTIRSFVCDQLRDEPDLSTLTLGILKKRYLAHMRCDSLPSEVKCFMKQVVEEELMKMQDNECDGKEVETLKPQKKRKRGKENDGEFNGTKDESGSRAKKSRHQLSSSSESHDKDDCKAERKTSGAEKHISPGSEDGEQEVKKSQRKMNRKRTPETPEDSSEDGDVSGENKNKSEDSDRQEEEDKKKEKSAENGTTDTNTGNKRPQIEEEDDSDLDSKSEKSDKVNVNDSSDESEKEAEVPIKKEKHNSDSDSSSLPSVEDDTDDVREKGKDKTKRNVQKEDESESDSKSEKGDRVNVSDWSDEGEKETKAPVKKEEDDSDSDSSSLPSVEDEPSDRGAKTKDNKKKRTAKKEEKERSQKDDHRAVARLKRYIAMCGVRRNYKKLLDGCRSVRSQVAVLKKELEELGVHGQPSIKKCKKARMQREQAEELAELDTSNIITAKGRPKRRGAWHEPQSPAASPHTRTLNSSSDSDEEKKKHGAGRRATDWDNLKGIISDDADSD